MKELLDISYEERISSDSTPPDDIEGTLYTFIPPDYTKSSYAFEEIVEKDALEFKPLGEKVGSYTRPSAAHTVSATVRGKKGKGKGKVNGLRAKPEISVLEEDSEDAVVYEMYKVSCHNI